MQEFLENLPGLALSGLYVASVVGAAELVRARTGRGVELTRKIVHVFVGLWIIPTLFLFTRWYWAALLPGLAVVGNLASLEFGLLGSIERDERSDYGTVLFAASFVAAIALFFESAHPEAAAAGITVMALGDASATAAGLRWGSHRYRLLGATKSLEGSAAMFLVSLASVFLVLAGLGALARFDAPAGAAALAALLSAVVGTALEAAGSHGLDNLTVPLACSGVSYAVLAALEV